MKLNREILRLSLPSIISNITIPLLGLSDTTISGHLGSENHIAAIAVGTMMFNVVFWLFGFFRMGTTGMTAQAFGREDRKKCEVVLMRSVFIAVSIGLILIVLQYPLQWLLLKFISPDAAVVELAQTYYYICIWGAPAILVNMSLLGWFLGMQNTVYTMVISLAVNVLNILISVLLVFVADMGFKGIAIGTLAANWIGILFAFGLLYRFCGKRFPRVLMSEILQIKELKNFFRINTDIFFRSACIMSVSLLITAFGAAIGSLTLAANTVIMQFFILFSYFMDGLAFTGEALVGRFAGASDWKMMNKSVGRLCLWAAVMALLFTLIYAFGCDYIISFITTNVSVITEIATYKIWILLLPLVTVTAFIFDGVYIGLTKTRAMLVATLMSTAVFFLISFVHPFSNTLISYPDNNTLWTAFLAYLFLRGVILSLKYFKGFSVNSDII